MNPSEEFVYQMVKSTFLSLWSYLNPIRNHNKKELCDVLVICDPYILIISVKHVTVTDAAEDPIKWKRWQRRAIDASIKQIYGAERSINQSVKVASKNGKKEIQVPSLSDRKIYRIAIALGGNNEIPYHIEKNDKGFVHVFDETSMEIIITELDTITDFIKYLEDKEQLFLNNNVKIIFEGGEEDLLGIYIDNNRSFPNGANMMIIQDGIWEEVKSKPEYIRKRKEDNDSKKIWDTIIEDISDYVLMDILEYEFPKGDSPQNSELALRQMAKESRFERRLLAHAFMDAFSSTVNSQITTRITVSDSGIVYLFQFYPLDVNRDHRTKELTIRCFLARGIYRDSPIIIGIATEVRNNQGYSFDLCYLEKELWDDKDQKDFDKIQQQTGFFMNTKTTNFHLDEYPSEDKE